MEAPRESSRQFHDQEDGWFPRFFAPADETWATKTHGHDYKIAWSRYQSGSTIHVP